MDVLILDVETSKKPIMHPWQKGAFLSTVGLKHIDSTGKQHYQDWLYHHDEMSDSAVSADVVKDLQRIFDSAGPGAILVGHNLKFDLNWIKHIGVVTHKLTKWDTMLAEHMLYGQDKKLKYGLSDCCHRAGIPVKTDLVKVYWEAGVNTNKVPLRILLPYQKHDVNITAELFKVQWTKLRSMARLKRLVQMRCSVLEVVSDIELNGMGIDSIKAQAKVTEFRTKIAGIDQNLMTFFKAPDGVEINLSSGHELSACLYGGSIKRVVEQPKVVTRNVVYKGPYQYTYKSGPRKGMTVTKYKNRILKELVVKKVKADRYHHIEGVGFIPPDGAETARPGVYQTDINTRKTLTCNSNGATTKSEKREILDLLNYRSKLSKFIATLEGKTGDGGILHRITGNTDGRVHPQYNQIVTSTGRFSSSGDMNGQNVARNKEDDVGFINPLKSLFIPSDPVNGRILVVDKSQLEWRVAAWLSQDQVALDEIRRGVDQHTENAIKIFGDVKYRQVAKILTFRLLYGGSAYAFYKDPLMPNFTLSKWQSIVDAFNRKYAGIARWQQDNITAVNRQDGILTSPTGRIYRIPQVPSKKYAGVMIYSETCIKNYPVQGTATGDLVPMAMSLIDSRIRRDPELVRNSKIILQVHDSVGFEIHRKIKVALAKLCINAIEAIPKVIEHLFGVPCNVPLTGEAECGPTYGDVTWKLKKVNGQWIEECV